MHSGDDCAWPKETCAAFGRTIRPPEGRGSPWTAEGRGRPWNCCRTLRKRATCSIGPIRSNLRLAAVQSLAKIDSNWAREFCSRSGFSAADLSLAPLDPLPNAKYFRRRRYPRVRLAQPIAAIATVGQDSYRLEIRGLSLSGGIAVGEKHLQPGTLVSMKIGSSLRPIRAQVLMRDARAQGLGFEFAEHGP